MAGGARLRRALTFPACPFDQGSRDSRPTWGLEGFLRVFLGLWDLLTKFRG